MDITQWIMESERSIRLAVFLGMLVLMGAWEWLAPKRARTLPVLLRWTNNLGLVFVNSFLLQLTFPFLAVGMASLAQAQGWGLLNSYALPTWQAIPLAVVALDFAIYLQHVMFHAVPVLWRLHRVHHADPDFDVTTGLRFHTLEILLSMGIKFGAILLLGPPVVAVILFEVLLNGMSMFNHGNVRLPLGLDKTLRWLVVTPDMHRVHHSVEDDEANSNFGFSLSLWDRLFGTYRDQPRAGHDKMHIGIHRYTDPKQVVWLYGLLLLPFVGRITGYTINRRQWNDTDES